MAYTRETVPSIIQIDTRTVRAGRGLAELLARPSVNIPARYGLVRRARGGASAVASTSASKLDGGDVEMDTQAEERPLSDYLVGAALDEALAKQAGRAAGGEEETVDVFWPWEAEVEEGELASVKRRAARIDWQGREAILWVLPPNRHGVQLTRTRQKLRLHGRLWYIPRNQHHHPASHPPANARLPPARRPRSVLPHCI